MVPRLFDDLPDAKQTKLAPITREVQLAIEEFLSHLQRSHEASSERIKAVPKQLRGEEMDGQLEYHDHAVGAYRHARSLNRTRRTTKVKDGKSVRK